MIPMDDIVKIAKECGLQEAEDPDKFMERVDRHDRCYLTTRISATGQGRSINMTVSLTYKTFPSTTGGTCQVYVLKQKLDRPSPRTFGKKLSGAVEAGDMLARIHTDMYWRAGDALVARFPVLGAMNLVLGPSSVNMLKSDKAPLDEVLVRNRYIAALRMSGNFTDEGEVFIELRKDGIGGLEPGGLSMRPYRSYEEDCNWTMGWLGRLMMMERLDNL